MRERTSIRNAKSLFICDRIINKDAVLLGQFVSREIYNSTSDSDSLNQGKFLISEFAILFLMDSI